MRNENSKTNKGGYTISKKRVYPCVCSNCNKNFDGPANGTKFCSEECKLESRIKEHPNKGLCLQCNGDNNPAQVVDNNELRAAVAIKPARVAEFIYLDLYCLGSDLSISEILK